MTSHLTVLALSAGTKAMLALRVLDHFSLSRPCSTPVQIVACFHVHTRLVLAGVLRIGAKTVDVLAGLGLSMLPTIATCKGLYGHLCSQVPDGLVQALQHCNGFACGSWTEDMLQGHAAAMIPQLRAGFRDFALFCQLTMVMAKDLVCCC